MRLDDFRLLKNTNAFIRFLSHFAICYYFWLYCITFNLFLNSYFGYTFVHMNDKDIKNRIARYRREHNLSQAEIAERLSISQTAYYKIEKGKTALISEHLPKIADALDLSEEALVLGYEPGEKEKYESIIAEKDRRIAELEAALADKNRIIELQDRLLRKI